MEYHGSPCDDYDADDYMAQDCRYVLKSDIPDIDKVTDYLIEMRDAISDNKPNVEWFLENFEMVLQEFEIKVPEGHWKI